MGGSIGPDGQVMQACQTGPGDGPGNIYVNVDPDGLGGAGFGPRFLASPTNVGQFDFIPAQSGRSVDGEAGLAWDRTGGPRTGRVYLVYANELPNLRVTDGTSNDNQANNGVDYGDYTALDYRDTRAHPAFADNSNSTGDNPDGTLNEFDIYSARVRARP